MATSKGGADLLLTCKIGDLIKKQTLQQQNPELAKHWRQAKYDDLVVAAYCFGRLVTIESMSNSEARIHFIAFHEHLDPALDSCIEQIRKSLPTLLIDLLGSEWQQALIELAKNLKHGGQLRKYQSDFLERLERSNEPLDFGNLAILFELLEGSGLSLDHGAGEAMSKEFKGLNDIRNNQARYGQETAEKVTKAYDSMASLDVRLSLGFAERLEMYRSKFNRALQQQSLLDNGVDRVDVVDVSGRLHALPLENAFEGVRLTIDQDEAVIAMKAFFDNPRADVFILNGYAGTGKTFLMRGIVQHLLAERGQASVGLVASTGRAAKVLSDVVAGGDDGLDISATTIHKFVYSGSDVVEMVRDKDDTETPVLVMKVATNRLPTNFVCLVDEASMVSDVLSEHENFRFGSGRLLHDLFVRLRIGTVEGAKLIFLGDEGQLPPVGMSHTPALDVDYIRDTYGHTASKHSLREVVRQKKDSGVLRLATELRAARFKDQMDTFPEWNEYPEDVALVGAEWRGPYFDEATFSLKQKAILVYSNKRAGELNEEIRDRLFPGKKEVQPGDVLMVIKNNYLDPLTMNGELVELLTSGKGVIQRSFRIKTRRKGATDEQLVTLKFREVRIRSLDWQPGQYADKLILENVLHSESPQLTSAEFKALYVDFKKRHPKLKANSPDFKDALKRDPFYNALQVKFGYAITVHKSQGGEWSEVYVDYDRQTGKSNADYFRWAYTATTRSKQRLYMMSSPFFAGKKVSTGMTATLNERLIMVPEKFKTGLPFVNSPTAMHEIVGGALAWMFTAIGGNLDSLKAEQYQVKVKASWQDKVYAFSIWFKGDGRLSKHNLENTEADKVMEGLNRLVKKLPTWNVETVSGGPMKPIAQGRGAFKCRRSDLIPALQERFGPSVRMNLESSEQWCENVVLTSPEGVQSTWKFYFKSNEKSSRNLLHPKSKGSPEWCNFIEQSLNE